jgi:hypothetical protein
MQEMVWFIVDGRMPDQPACVWMAVGAAHKTAISVAVRLLMVMEGCFGFLIEEQIGGF